ncbi:MAG: DUF3857 domain-containing transglutaminase family protein [Calditrichia bacterium]
MLRTLPIILLLAVSSTLSAQPDWVWGTYKASANYSIPSEVSVATLLLERDVVISRNSNTETRVRKVIKVLKDDIREKAVLKIPTHTWLEIKKTKGWLLRKGDKAKSLKKENIVEMTPDGYSDSRVLIASFSDVVAGDVIAYEYTLKEKGWTSLFQRMIFQVQNPVKKTILRLKIPVGWVLNRYERNMAEFSLAENGNVFEWRAENLAYRPNEALMPPWGYLTRRIDFTAHKPGSQDERHFSNWQDVANWYAELADKQDALIPTIKNKTSELVKGAATLQDSLEAIARFVQRDIRYEAIEIKKGRFIPTEAGKTLHNLYGDCKDKTTLMRAMLKSIGLETSAVLASVQSAANDSLPTPFQFDHCIIAISTAKLPSDNRFVSAIRNNWLFFDPTDTATPLGEIPYSLLGKPLVVCKANIDVLQEFPYQDPRNQFRRFAVNGELTSDGAVNMKVKISDHGGRAQRQRYFQQSSTGSELRDGLAEHLQSILPGSSLSDFMVEDMGDSITTNFTVSHTNFLESVPPYKVMRSSIFALAHIEKLPRGKRVHDIWFGSPAEVEVRNRWELPESWKVNLDTTALKQDIGAVQLESNANILNNVVVITNRYRNSGKIIEAKKYGDARKLSAKVGKLNAMKILIEK